MKLKLSLFDKIFNRDKFKEIIYLREQVEHMVKLYTDTDILIRMDYVLDGEDLTLSMIKYEMFSFDEQRMYFDRGEKAVIERLRNDRDKIYNKLKRVKEIDVSDIGKSIRNNKLNNILC